MKKFYDMMFTREPSNLGRQIELDITKALCIFFMVIVHIVEELGVESAEVSGSFSNFLIYVLAGFTGAGTFMLCMGIGFGYTRHSEAKDFIKRGAITLLLSYVLNFVRAFVHMFFCIPKLDISTFDKWALIGFNMLDVDIMQFAGLAMLVFGLFKLAKMKPWHMFAIAFSLSLGATLFMVLHGQETTGSIMGDGVLSLFWPMWYLEEGETVADFPLVCYLIFPIAGYCISYYYKKIKNKNLFFGIALGLSAIVIAAYVLINPIENQQSLFREGDIGYCHIYIWDALINVITSMGLIGLCYFASLILPKFALNGCHEVSKNINKIYCISWVILLNGIGIYDGIMLSKGLETPEVVDDWINILIGIGVFIISALIAHYYVKFKEAKKEKKNADLASAQ